jgi:hypothetical protein
LCLSGPSETRGSGKENGWSLFHHDLLAMSCTDASNIYDFDDEDGSCVPYTDGSGTGELGSVWRKLVDGRKVVVKAAYIAAKRHDANMPKEMNDEIEIYGKLSGLQNDVTPN